MPKLRIWKPGFLDYLGAIGPGIVRGIAGGLGARQKKKEEEEATKLLIPMIEKALGMEPGSLGKELVPPGRTYQPEGVLPSQEVPGLLKPLATMPFEPSLGQVGGEGSQISFTPTPSIPDREYMRKRELALRPLLDWMEHSPGSLTAERQQELATGLLGEFAGQPSRGVPPRETPVSLSERFSNIGIERPSLPQSITMPGLAEVGETPGVYKYDPATMASLLKILPGLAALKPSGFTLGPGQTRFEGKEPIASLPKEVKEALGFTLGPGQTRFEGSGKPIASLPKITSDKIVTRPDGVYLVDPDTGRASKTEIPPESTRGSDLTVLEDAQGNKFSYNKVTGGLTEIKGVKGKPALSPYETRKGQLKAEQESRQDIIKTITASGIQLSNDQKASIIAGRTLPGSQENLRRDIAIVETYISALLKEFNLPGLAIMLEKGGARLTEEDKARVRAKYEQQRPSLIAQGFNPELLNLYMEAVFDFPVGAVMTPSKSETWEEKKKRILGR